MENSKLSVEAIEQGTVIDHIPAGKGLAILSCCIMAARLRLVLICPVKRREAKTLSKSAVCGWMPMRPTV